MSKRIPSLFAVLLTVSLGCDNDDDTPISTPLVTISADASFNTSDSDDWAVVHDENGVMLDFKSFESDQIMDLSTSQQVSGNIGVTLIRHFTANDVEYTYVNSYLNIGKGEIVVLKTDLSFPPGVSGALTMSISDLTAVDHSTIGSRLGASGTSRWNNITKTLDLRTDTFAGITKYIVSLSDGSQLRYKELGNVPPNEFLGFSISNMLPFDTEVNFTFPSCNNVVLNVSASEPDPSAKPNAYGLVSHSNYDSHTHSSMKAGYLNNLTNYKTRLILTYSDFGYEFLDIGSIPNVDIVWPLKSDFTIPETSIQNFRANATTTFLWRASTWSYVNSGHVVNWNVFGSTNSQVLTELPSEITDQYPELALTNQQHAYTTFYTRSSYSKYIHSIFAGESDPPGLRLGIKILTK